MKFFIRRTLNNITFGLWYMLKSRLSPLVKDNIIYFINSDIGRELYFYGKFEKEELEICQKFINEDSTVIDIGANIGIHSVFFANLAPKGMILSIEPQTTIYPILLHNIKKYNNIIPLNIAVDKNLNISQFFIAEDNAYSSLKDTKRKKIVNNQKTICLPIDLIIDIFKKVDFVKIDVEGFETNVVLSMRKLLERDKPVVFVEIYRGLNSNPDPQSTIDILIDMGYQAYVKKGKYLVKFTEHNDNYYNYFFIYE